jgi:hypothetical protein
MPKMPDMVNPLTGNHTKLSVGNALGMVIAASVGIAAIATAQNINKKISGKMGIDTTIEPLTAERPKVVESFKRYV